MNDLLRSIAVAAALWLSLPETRVQLSVGPNAETRLALLGAIEQAGWHAGEVPEALQKLLMRLCP